MKPPLLIEANLWQLPGLMVQVETNASGPRLVQNEAYTDIIYTGDHQDGGAFVPFKLKVASTL